MQPVFPKKNIDSTGIQSRKHSLYKKKKYLGKCLVKSVYNEGSAVFQNRIRKEIIKGNIKD